MMLLIHNKLIKLLTQLNYANIVFTCLNLELKLELKLELNLELVVDSS